MGGLDVWLQWTDLTVRAEGLLGVAGSIGHRPFVESALRLEMMYGTGYGFTLADSWTAKLSFGPGY